jgi:hypothetical protein
MSGEIPSVHKLWLDTMTDLRKDFAKCSLTLQREFQSGIFDMREKQPNEDVNVDPDDVDVVNVLVTNYTAAKLGNLLRVKAELVRHQYNNALEQKGHSYQRLRKKLLAVMHDSSDYSVVWSADEKFGSE